MLLSSGLLLQHLKWKPQQSLDRSVTYQQTSHPRLGSGSLPQCPCKGRGPLLLSHIPTPTPALLHHWPRIKEGNRILLDRSLSDSSENRLDSKSFHSCFPNLSVQFIICAAQDPHLSDLPASTCMLLVYTSPPKNPATGKTPRKAKLLRPKTTLPTTLKYIRCTNT